MDTKKVAELLREGKSEEALNLLEREENRRLAHENAVQIKILCERFNQRVIQLIENALLEAGLVKFDRKLRKITDPFHISDQDLLDALNQYEKDHRG